MDTPTDCLTLLRTCAHGNHLVSEEVDMLAAIEHARFSLHNQIYTALHRHKKFWPVPGTCAVLVQLCGFSKQYSYSNRLAPLLLACYRHVPLLVYLACTFLVSYVPGPFLAHLSKSIFCQKMDLPILAIYGNITNIGKK